MSRKGMERLIDEIESRLVLLRKELTILSSSTSETARGRVRNANIKSRGGSTEPIKKLIEAGFFDKPKTDVEVISALKKKAFTFKRKFIAVTLMRLVRNGSLERDGGTSKSNPWKYKKA
jgi:hypothetical protein